MLGIKSAWLLLGRSNLVIEQARFNEAHGNGETGTGAGN